MYIVNNRQQSAVLHASVMTVFQIIINGQISSRPIILYEVLQKIGGCQIKFDEFCTKVFLSSWRLTWLAWDAIFSRTMRWKQNIHTIYMKWIYEINWGVYEIYIKYKSSIHAVDAMNVKANLCQRIIPDQQSIIFRLCHSQWSSNINTFPQDIVFSSEGNQLFGKLTPFLPFKQFKLKPWIFTNICSLSNISI